MLRDVYMFIQCICKCSSYCYVKLVLLLLTATCNTVVSFCYYVSIVSTSGCLQHVRLEHIER